MVLASFQIKNTLRKAQFFQKIFLVINISMDVILEMPFLTFTNTNMQFTERGLIWRSYCLAKVLSITKWVQIINKKKFAIANLDLDKKSIFVYVAYLDTKILIYPAWEAQIVLLITEKVAIPAEYSDYANVFSKESATEIFEWSNINQHAIELEPNKQLLYSLIYSLGLVKLEILKTYIKINLTNDFICPFKFPTKIPIFFVQKLDNSLCLYVDY